MTKPSARSIHPSHLADLDGFDRAILAIVQRDSTVPLRLLAEQVNLSTAAVQRRLKRMQEYEALARRLFAENPNVKWFKTIVALDRVKVGLEIPCE
jgi:DNA-binding Lrp family transcriptional regulator